MKLGTFENNVTFTGKIDVGFADPANFNFAGRLTEGADYVNEGGAIVLKQRYPTQWEPGSYALLFTFSAGNSSILTVHLKPASEGP